MLWGGGGGETVVFFFKFIVGGSKTIEFLTETGVMLDGFLDQVLEDREVIDQGAIALRDIVWVVEVVFPINEGSKVIGI